MSTKDLGGPAFPPTYQNPMHGGPLEGFEGMDLRDYFAAKAMQAAATNPTGADVFTFYERAKWAYAQADAMLKARTE